METRTRPSPWWPSRTDARVFLVIYLAIGASLYLGAGRPWLALYQAYSWYYVVAGLRALMYPDPVKTRAPVSAWWPATFEGRVFLVGSFVFFLVPALSTGTPLAALPAIGGWYLLVAGARAILYAPTAAPTRSSRR